MTTFADMGFWMARVKIEGSPEEISAELFIVEPSEESNEAQSVTITGLDSLLALRNCIDDEIAKYQHALDLARQDIPQ